MIIGKNQPDHQMMDLIAEYKGNLAAIMGYVPNADIRETNIVNGLIRFLSAKDEDTAYRAVVYGNEDFKQAIGYVQAYNPGFNEIRIKEMAVGFYAKAQAQKIKSPDELLQQMRNYQQLVQNQMDEKEKLSTKIVDLLDLERYTLNTAVKKMRFTARGTRAQFEKAAKMLNDLTFGPNRKKATAIDVEKLSKLVLTEFDDQDIANMLVDNQTTR